MKLYGLSHPSILVEISTDVPTRLLEGVEFDMHTVLVRILNAITVLFKGGYSLGRSRTLISGGIVHEMSILDYT